MFKVLVFPKIITAMKNLMFCEESQDLETAATLGMDSMPRPVSSFIWKYKCVYILLILGLYI